MTRFVVLGFPLALALALATACTRDEATAERNASPPAATSVWVPPPSASGTALVVAAGGSAAPVVSASAAPAASGSAPAVACGEKGQPDCPLQEWMKRVANKPMLAKDAPAVAEAFDKMVPLAPPGAAYANWASISKDGAKAARAADLDAAKAACRGCHDQYKRKYKTELRTRALP